MTGKSKVVLKKHSITMAMVIILSCKAQNSSTANDHHSMAMVVTTHTFINVITQGPKSLKNAK
jgi:hypothetical protein